MARVKRLEDNASERVHRQSPRDGQRAVEQAHRRHCLRPNLDGSSFRRARRRPHLHVAGPHLADWSNSTPPQEIAAQRLREGFFSDGKVEDIKVVETELGRVGMLHCGE